MAIVRHEVGSELTFEQREAMRTEIFAAAKRVYTYDPDCPLVTLEQLAEFKPVHFTSLDERNQAMQESSVTYA